MNRGDLSNEQWERLKPLPPASKPRTGKPNNDHRTVINGILWILRTGAPWPDMPERYEKWESAATRFYRWQKAGIWNQILQHLQASFRGEASPRNVASEGECVEYVTRPVLNSNHQKAQIILTQWVLAWKPHSIDV
ncbi:transposase [Plectonema radiosum NIES-515]|uniref:Transposase n=1 Tax=Plectonema radiosum NIES-515 TaxID=2986073 RepID=A0ABT3B5G9_9CYAN|nr:transposase [Plectonema radiosum]MCV3216623.1 transposase [Plectonema radiosum NIES-515]